MALGPTQPTIQWVPGSLSLGVKWPGREADHSPPSSAEVKEWVELYLHSPNTPYGVVLSRKKSTGTTLPFTFNNLNASATSIYLTKPNSGQDMRFILCKGCRKFCFRSDYPENCMIRLDVGQNCVIYYKVLPEMCIYYSKIVIMPNKRWQKTYSLQGVLMWHVWI
jgi:hypothetical protein